MNSRDTSRWRRYLGLLLRDIILRNRSRRSGLVYFLGHCPLRYSLAPLPARLFAKSSRLRSQRKNHSSLLSAFCWSPHPLP